MGLDPKLDDCFTVDGHVHPPPPPRERPSPPASRPIMKDERLLHDRLVRLQGELLNWGTPGAQASVTTRDELRGWIRALEWALGRTRS